MEKSGLGLEDTRMIMRNGSGLMEASGEGMTTGVLVSLMIMVMKKIIWV